MIFARLSSIVFDGLVMGLTWSYTRHIGRRDVETYVGDSIEGVLMRSTAIHVGLVTAVNIIGVGIAFVHLMYIEAITTWTTILASILLSRLLLDLHEVNSAENETGSRATRPTLDTIAFTTVSLADNEEVF